jgi:hypothetical protein
MDGGTHINNTISKFMNLYIEKKYKSLAYKYIVGS